MWGMHRKFWSENLKGTSHLEGTAEDGIDNIKMDLK
jgi:hypothetical protein